MPKILGPNHILYHELPFSLWINSLCEPTTSGPPPPQKKHHSFPYLVIVVENRSENLVETDGGTDSWDLRTACLTHRNPRPTHALHL